MSEGKGRVFWKVLKGRLIFAGFLLVACFIFTHWILPNIHQSSSEFVLTEAGERQLLRLRKNLQSGNIRQLKIRIRGHLNGTAMIRVFDPNDLTKTYQEKMVGSGEVDVRMLGADWYTDDCRMEYQPLSATTGGLKIEYQFKT